ncbi:U3 small nucleolar ribonucleoprotein protein IMP4 isoform X3 [Scyliorhinus torazame]|uniref:U3 small nucleolar ribonucleoprotein protein IMP4 isoform X3 n=1 Tax=Scyliorhinus torazame TaxID=75743 RepID=UPI003B59F6E7
MLRREARLRREYLYHKAQEDKLRSVEEKKQKLKCALEENKLIPTELRRDALELQKVLEYDDEGGEGISSQIDDEYKWAGVEDPKIMITTSRDPSSKLKQFAKVSNILKYLFPVPKDDSRRVITFANQDDYISFRHHVYKKMDHRNIELSEVGPRFEMKLYQIKLGTLENEKISDTEWRWHPYTNTAKKKRYLSME